jgi:hypothetical protein
LTRRLKLVERQLAVLERRSQVLPDALRSVLREALLEEDVAAAVGRRGLRDIPVRFSPPGAQPMSVARLIRTLGGDTREPNAVVLLDLIHDIYLLQYSLHWPIARVEPCLADLRERLRNLTLYDAVIDHVQPVWPDQLVDDSTMWPRNDGMKVRQPLGVAVLDKSGRVLQKAQVLCA